MAMQEKVIAHGVYMTDFRATKTNQIVDPNVVITHIRELQVSLKHLVRSNEELLQAFQEDNDNVWYEAHQDNLPVIEKQRKQIRTYLELLQQDFPHIAEGLKEPKDLALILGEDKKQETNNATSTSDTPTEEDSGGIYL